MKLWRRKKDKQDKAAQALDDRGWMRIFDWTPGAWQTHHPYDAESSVQAYPTVFACQTLIEGDISKQKTLIQKKQGNIWVTVSDHPLMALIKKPNAYQNQIQFKAAWISSKLTDGNTYALKVRKAREIIELHVQDPFKVMPLISENGEVFYRLNKDRLTGFDEHDDEQIVVPSTEIIHDRFNCLFHPLVGLSPIFAAGISATAGLKQQANMKNFFSNESRPSGILTAPGSISEPTAIRLKEYFENNFKGDNVGRVAIAGDDLKWEQLRMSNVDAQVVELMGWNDGRICSVYHVPPYMVNVGDAPAYNNIEALTQAYYSQCLQILIESMEMAMDEGLGIESDHRIQLDIDRGLFRMDSKTLMETLGVGAKSGFIAPNEGRERINLPPVDGGESPLVQQQNWSLPALARRDAVDPEAETTDEQRALELFDIMTRNCALH
ncbi:MAG: phage portal protein, partial [Rhodospirillaceae bacterium]|nr:phage portal protein [Rhodospirillaceae bacterium]